MQENLCPLGEAGTGNLVGEFAGRCPAGFGAGRACASTGYGPAGRPWAYGAHRRPQGNARVVFVVEKRGLINARGRISTQATNAKWRGQGLRPGTVPTLAGSTPWWSERFASHTTFRNHPAFRPAGKQTGTRRSPVWGLATTCPHKGRRTRPEHPLCRILSKNLHTANLYQYFYGLRLSAARPARHGSCMRASFSRTGIAFLRLCPMQAQACDKYAASCAISGQALAGLPGVAPLAIQSQPGRPTPDIGSASRVSRNFEAPVPFLAPKKLSA